MLNTIHHDAKCAVDNVESRINAHGSREENPAIGRSAIEEIAVVKIAVRDERDRLRRLVNREIIPCRQHNCSSRFARPFRRRVRGRLANISRMRGKRHLGRTRYSGHDPFVKQGEKHRAE